MIRRLSALLAIPALVLLVGCSQIGDAAKEIAGEAASQAGSAAAAELQEQICTPLEDGKLSEQDQQVLAGLLSAAEAAGVPTEYTTPLEGIAGENASADSVAALIEACATTGAPTP